MNNWLSGLDAENIAADLVAKLNSTSLESEEGSVASLLRRGLELNRNLKRGTSNDFILESDNLGVHVVTRGLEELSASRPACLTVITHPPGLAEHLATVDLMLVWEALLDKTS